MCEPITAQYLPGPNDGPPPAQQLRHGPGDEEAQHPAGLAEAHCNTAADTVLETRYTLHSRIHDTE